MWAKRRPARQVIDILILAAVSALLFLGLGSRLAGASYESLSAWLAGAPAYLDANLRFAEWQLKWALGSMPIDAFSRFDSPRWALVADLFFIPAYATILGWLGAKAFAKAARFTRADDEPRPLLSMLGRALPCLVFADIAENVVTLTLITVAPCVDAITLSALGALMSLSSAAKFIGLIGVGLLLMWGYLFSPRKAEGP